MKKFLLILAMLPTLASAQHYYHHNHRPHWRYQNNAWTWMVPAVIGGVVVYEATKNPPPQPIIVQQPPQENCTAWTEIQTPDGRIVRERVCQK